MAASENTKRAFWKSFDLEEETFSDPKGNTYKVTYYAEGLEITFTDFDSQEEITSPFYDGMTDPEIPMSIHFDLGHFPEPEDL